MANNRVPPQARQIISQVIDNLEGGKAQISGDSGGRTLFGLTEKYHPEFIREFWGEPSLKSPPREGARDAAISIYFDEYLTHIRGWQWLMDNVPWLLALLMFGRVHGAGFRQYVREVQRSLVKQGHVVVVDGLWGPATLAALQSLTPVERNRMYMDLSAAQPSLIRARQRSVRAGGAIGVDKGIRNRVVEEFNLASAYRPRDLDPSQMAAYAALGATPPVGVRV